MLRPPAADVAAAPVAGSATAGLLGTTPQHVAALIRSGSLEAADVSIGGARRPSWRIPQDSLARVRPTGTIGTLHPCFAAAGGKWYGGLSSGGRAIGSTTRNG